jgi:UTP--glucose-1-phosphate uridylyltransferase
MTNALIKRIFDACATQYSLALSDSDSRNFQDCLRKCYEANQSEQFLEQFASQLCRYVLGLNIRYDLKNCDALQKDKITHLSALISSVHTKEYTDRMAVLKLNGGLGTSMGCEEPKSVIDIGNNQTFLDAALSNHHAFNLQFSSAVPLLLMNSFYTNEAMKNRVDLDNIKMITQHQLPRLIAGGVEAFDCEVESQQWAPPGHGDVFLSLYESGFLDQLLSEGRDILFISNIDNSLATCDLRIVQYICDNQVDFLMEVTQKTAVDRKGGTLAKSADSLCLIERSMIDADSEALFDDIHEFQLFNTNNIWINLRALKALIESNDIELPVIVNKKNCDGTDVIQLETAMGSAISCFKQAACLYVDRDRFFPVKTTADLLLLRAKRENKVCLNASPTIVFDENYQAVYEFDRLFQVIPNMRELTSLSIQGKFVFLDGLKLVGDVCLENSSQNKIILRDQLITG